MCLSIPGKIQKIYEEGSLTMGKVDFGGIVKEVCLDYVPEAKVGEYVLIHVGPGQALAAEGDHNRKIVGVGDFDGNGRANILWRHATTGQNRIWFAGTTPGTPIPNVTDLSWKVRP